MAVFSMRSRKKMMDAGIGGAVCLTALMLQMDVINHFPVNNVYFNLPLTLVILWGCVTGSPLPPITADELRLGSVGQIFFRQAASGSVSGFLLGALMAALYGSVLPVYPIYLPIIGWVAGYFSLRSINQVNFLCIPIVFVLTGLAESIMAWQLWLCGKELIATATGTGSGSNTISLVFGHLWHIVVPEAIINSVAAPMIYFPMRRYFDVSTTLAIPKEV